MTEGGEVVILQVEDLDVWRVEVPPFAFFPPQKLCAKIRLVAGRAP